ncbi:MAG: hypothetical protein ACTS22_09365 [Phycisphaerales bacterium]
MSMPVLYPTPRSVEPVGGIVNAALSCSSKVRSDPDRCPQPGGYEIIVRPDGSVDAWAHDEDGVFSARSTLRQLIQSGVAGIPSLRIRDWPAFRVRGFMLDVSRDRIPTMEHLREIVTLLSDLRMNHLQLYVEHTIEYPGHEAVCAGLDPLTGEQLATLDGWCRSAGIELAANQNCFGHLSGWLRHARYADLAETHGPYEFYGTLRDGPFSLCPIDPRSAALVREWLTNLACWFSSRLVNIGCDETADIGSGRSRDAVQERGRSRVYGDFVRRVAEDALGLGLSPLFWGDIALEDRSILEMLPPELLALAWGYEPTSPYSRWSSVLTDAGRRFWVCPGTSCWRSFIGRTAERRGALRAAAACEGDAEGMLVTAWGDLGHRQQWPITAFALADAAQVAWNGRDAVSSSGQAANVAFGSSGLGDWLADLGDVDADIRARGGVPRDGQPQPILNAGALFEVLHPARPGFRPSADLADWCAVHDRLNGLTRVPKSDDRHLAAEVRWSVDMAMLAAELAMERCGGRPVESLVDKTDDLEERHRRLWLKRSRPGGLDSSCAWFEQIRRAPRGAML